MADAAAAAAAAPEVYAAAEAEEKMPEIRLALCKGRMKDGVFKLFADAGIKVSLGHGPATCASLFVATALAALASPTPLPSTPRPLRSPLLSLQITLGNERAYRPTVSWGNFDAKLLKVRIS